MESDDETKYLLFIPKNWNNYQWQWYWWCTLINLYLDSQTSKNLLVKFGCDYWFSCKFSCNISKHKPQKGSSCIWLPKELDHVKEGLINIQNINDNEWFK